MSDETKNEGGNGSSEWRERWFKSLGNDMSDLKKGISALKEDMTSARLETERARLEAERTTGIVRSELGSVKTDILQGNIETERAMNTVRTEIHIVKDDLGKQIEEIRVDMSGLKIKAGIWGTIGASIPAGIIVMSQFWK